MARKKANATTTTTPASSEKQGGNTIEFFLCTLPLIEYVQTQIVVLIEKEGKSIISLVLQSSRIRYRYHEYGVI